MSGVIENLRLIKTSSEIKILKEAAAIADAAFTHILDFLRPGISELDVSNELEFFMRKQGNFFFLRYHSSIRHKVRTPAWSGY